MKKATVIGNSIYKNNQKIANFSLKKIDEFIYQIDNGKRQNIFCLKNKSLKAFRNKIESLGFYFFDGNTKDLNEILEHTDSQGIKKPSPQAHREFQVHLLMFKKTLNPNQEFKDSTPINFFLFIKLALSIKGYEFKNFDKLEKFYKTRCKVVSKSNTIKTYFLDDIPFLETKSKMKFEPINKTQNLTSAKANFSITYKLL